MVQVFEAGGYRVKDESGLRKWINDAFAQLDQPKLNEQLVRSLLAEAARIQQQNDLDAIQHLEDSD